MKLALIFSLFLTLNLAIFAKDKGAAKVIVLKGKVSALIGGKKKSLKKGDWLPVGAQVKTEKRSFTKLLFIDKSTMNVGPNSQMKIDAFPKKDAGIITLVKGQIRSKVTKNYMEMKKKNKSKLFIKTKTAAMGVRGTDFQVSYNRANQNTTLVTFEGAVAMAKLGAGIKKFNQRALERVVSSPTAVMVRQGQFSGASPKSEKTTAPVKISPVQLETLESKPAPGLKTDDANSSSLNTPKKKFRKVVPPGVDAKTVANDGSELNKSLGSAIKNNSPIAPKNDQPIAADPNGPKPGTIVHMETGLFISPPEDAELDPNTQTYKVPTELAFVDPNSGELTTKDYELNSAGEWENKPSKAGSIAEQNEPNPNAEGDRAPASANEGDELNEPLAGTNGGGERDGPEDSEVLENGPAGPPKLSGPEASDTPPVGAPQFGGPNNALAPVRPDICPPPNCFQPPDIIPGRPVNVNNGKSRVIFAPVIE